MPWHTQVVEPDGILPFFAAVRQAAYVPAYEIWQNQAKPGRVPRPR
ncbi:hypothetical protein [Bifidobacterium thermophilum]